MCGRIIYPEARAIYEEMTQITRGVKEMPAQINVPPGKIPIPVVTDKEPDCLQYFNWPLVPYYSTNWKYEYDTKNAKYMNLESSRLWNKYAGKKHCVIITSAFYEWTYPDPVKKKPGTGIPHVIKRKGHKLTLMAGLWDTWTDMDTGEIKPSCAMIVFPGNEVMRKLHNTKDSMPAFINEEQAKIWLDSSLSWEERKAALIPVENDFIAFTPIKNVADLDEVSSALIC